MDKTKKRFQQKGIPCCCSSLWLQRVWSSTNKVRSSSHTCRMGVSRHSRQGIRDIGRSSPVDSILWTFVAGITCRIRIGTHGWRVMPSRVKTKSTENLHLTAWFVFRCRQPPASVPREYAACAWRRRAPCAWAARAPNATAPGAVSLPPRFSILCWKSHRFSGRKLSCNACLPSFLCIV